MYSTLVSRPGSRMAIPGLSDSTVQTVISRCTSPLTAMMACTTDATLMYTLSIPLPTPKPYTRLSRSPKPCGSVATTGPPSSQQQLSKYTPVLKSKQLESEIWLLRLRSPGVSQLDLLPGNVLGIPVEFDHHPIRFIDFKAQARVQKQAAQRSAVQ